MFAASLRVSFCCTLAQPMQNQGLQQLVFPRFFRGAMELLSDAGCFFDTLWLDEVPESCHVLPRIFGFVEISTRQAKDDASCMTDPNEASPDMTRIQRTESHFETVLFWSSKAVHLKMFWAFQGLTMEVRCRIIEGLGSKAYTNLQRNAFCSIVWSLLSLVSISVCEG